ncbi:sensor histidine kinase [Algibacter pacificus]|uniref:sensor histidine kinase n=1 Tax=Algibacter pacificus TaxID=2599389 RepID=UPI0011C97BAA|nr:ATP-binding protein [Algibacter pacificus]
MLSKIWESYLQWYIQYSRFSEREEKENLAYYRDKLFISIMLLTLIFGVISYIPSAYLAYTKNEHLILIADTIALTVIIATMLNKSMSLNTKKTIFLISFFLLAFVLTLALGFKGNGAILLYTLSVITTLIGGRKPGLLAILIIAIFYSLLILNKYFSIIIIPVYNNFDIKVLTVVVMNNLIFNLLIVFSVSFLINQLHAALMKENKLQLELSEKHNNVLEAKIKVEKSDKLKSTFLANMSHEIRTPMYGILGCAQFLKDYQVDDEDYHEYLNIIETSGEQLLEVMSDIINISIIESNLMLTNISMFDISDNINTVYHAYLSEAKNKNLEFILKNNIAVHEGYIKSDTHKITSVLKHLIKNAIKFTNKGSIELVCERQDEKHIAFCLSDTGIGIDKINHEYIFDTFYQVDSENKNALHGSGIGLTIAKAYIEMLGGEISIESEVGIGTSFLFTIKVNLT